MRGLPAVLISAPVFIEHSRAVVDVALPRGLVAIPGRVGPRHGVPRDAVRVGSVQPLLPVRDVLAAAGQRKYAKHSAQTSIAQT